MSFGRRQHFEIFFDQEIQNFLQMKIPDVLDAHFPLGQICVDFL